MDRETPAKTIWSLSQGEREGGKGGREVKEGGREGDNNDYNL